MSGAPECSVVFRNISLVSGKPRKRKKKPPPPPPAEPPPRPPPRPSPQSFINPCNVEEARLAFFEHPSKSPQFRYPHNGKAARLLAQHSQPHTAYMAAAVRVMETTLGKYGCESRYLTEVGDMVMSQDQCAALVRRWLEQNRVDDLVELHFNPNAVASCSMQGRRFMVGLPVQLRLNRLDSVLKHEVGTHFMRGLNDKKQKWHGDRHQFGLSESWLESEEGLACLNTHLDSDPHMWKAALNYYCAVRASQVGFAALHAELVQHWVDCPDSAWRLCLRVKRGLRDSGKRGAYCRDQCYFVGALQILERRHQIDFRLLHAGRITLEDYEELKPLIRSKQLLLPEFLTDMEGYRRLLERIIDANQIREFLE